MKRLIFLAILLCTLTAHGSQPIEGDEVLPSDGPRAHDCRLCEKPIPPGKEVPLLTSTGSVEFYRCIHCAMTAQAAAAGRSTIKARSLVSGTEILVEVNKGRWSVEPPTAVFLALPEEEGECMERHQAFVDASEYRHYLEQNSHLPAERAQAYTIDELSEILVAGLPRTGIPSDAEVELLVVGMITHLPFKQSVLPEIEAALSELGDSVDVRWVDANEPAGRAILQSHGITEHLPVVMFVDGQTRFDADGRSVILSGFPGANWSREELAGVLERAVAEAARR